MFQKEWKKAEEHKRRKTQAIGTTRLQKINKENAGNYLKKSE